MNSQEVATRYPRITAALLAEAQDTDVEWATDVIQSAKETRSEMSVGLVREAFRKRCVRKERYKAASRLVEGLIGDVSDVPSTSNFTLPQTG